MIIPPERLAPYLESKPQFIVHVGSHLCEEIDYYHSLGLDDTKIIWIESNHCIAQQAKNKFPESRIYSAVINDKDDELIKFNLASHSQSSSILELGTHQNYHPDITYISNITLKTVRLDRFLFSLTDLPKQDGFLNCDIQGAEYKAIVGLGPMIERFNYIYLEINIEQVYLGCRSMNDVDSYLEIHGFFRVETQMTPYGYGDAFYINRSRLKKSSPA